MLDIVSYGIGKKASGSGGTAISAELKTALLQLAQKVAYVDNSGPQVYSALSSALDGGSSATLSSISAVLDLGTHLVHAGDSLDSLKTYLTVTATYSDSSTSVVAADAYTLSGTLTVGTSTITVSYIDKTTTFTVTVSEDTYTANVIYSNYTATGAKFSTDNISINFANGDYVEAKINATACTTDNTNLLTIAKSGNTDYFNYNSGECIMCFKRLQSNVDKIFFRVRDIANDVSKDVRVVPADMSNLTIKLDKDGVYLDGTAVSGITASTLAFLTGQSAIAIGARSSVLSVATYTITVYNKD